MSSKYRPARRVHPGSGGHSRTGLRIYVHHGAPFCVLTVKRHCLPFTFQYMINKFLIRIRKISKMQDCVFSFWNSAHGMADGLLERLPNWERWKIYPTQIRLALSARLGRSYDSMHYWMLTNSLVGRKHQTRRHHNMDTFPRNWPFVWWEPLAPWSTIDNESIFGSGNGFAANIDLNHCWH